MTSRLNVWELISISKGWGRQGRNPKSHAKAPESLTEPGLLSKPGLGWAYISGTPHELPLPCSALLQVWSQTGLRGWAHLPTPGSAVLSWRAAWQDSASQHLVLSLLSLSSSLSVVAIIALFLTVLLPRESLHSSCTYLACARIFENVMNFEQLLWMEITDSSDTKNVSFGFKYVLIKRCPFPDRFSWFLWQFTLLVQSSNTSSTFLHSACSIY